MPGTGDGSSWQNAFDWDHTQYPGGTRVFGQTARYSGVGINRYDYWAMTLEAGKTYAVGVNSAERKGFMSAADDTVSAEPYILVFKTAP